ncbi:MAG: hypothetical protein ACRECT_01875 [Thermoplasmata archaeon]
MSSARGPGVTLDFSLVCARGTRGRPLRVGDPAGPSVGRQPPHLRLEDPDLFAALRATAESGVDVVDSHARYLLLPDEKIGRLAREVYRVERTEGPHLLAVRATTDPRARRGREPAPDVWVHPPETGPTHGYRAGTLTRSRRPGFEPVAEELSAGAHR